MDTIQTNDHKQENYILKSNLWKLFKTLRAQANPVFSLLAASPIHSAWIVMYKKDNHSDYQRITVSKFVDNLKNIPNVNTLFKLGIRLYYPANQRISCGGGITGIINSKPNIATNYHRKQSLGFSQIWSLVFARKPPNRGMSLR